MNIQKKEQLVPGLAKVFKTLCSYGGGERCDCKYGADKVGHLREDGCGCPEVRAAHALIKAMTPKEFARIEKRINSEKPKPKNNCTCVVCKKAFRGPARQRARAEKAERELAECARDAVTKMTAAIDRAEKAERDLAEWPCVGKDARRREHTWNIAHAVGASYCVHCEVKERDAGHRTDEKQHSSEEENRG